MFNARGVDFSTTGVSLVFGEDDAATTPIATMGMLLQEVRGLRRIIAEVFK